MSESERKTTTNLADALASVQCTDSEAAVFLNVIANLMSEIHSEFRNDVLKAASELAYAPPATTKPASAPATKTG
jgi:hypothetical protein